MLECAMGQDRALRPPKKNGLASESSTDTAQGIEDASPLMIMQQTSGNHAATQQAMQIQGPMGRVFNRILGLPESSQEGLQAGFTVDQLRNYLEQTLQLAKGEWFRSAKLNGVSEELMMTLDTDQDGLVSWAEFTVFQQQTLETIAPNLDENRTVSDTARSQFSEVDTSSDQRITYSEARDSILQGLPQETEHKDLIAQLGALIALDAIDQDQQDQAVRDRALTQEEWLAAAVAMANEDQKTP